jgi:hypothetical protein
MSPWERFAASLDTSDPREITFDIAAMRELTGDDRSRALDALEQRIVRGDVRAIETALATPLPELEFALRKIGPEAPSPAREAVARALARFGDKDSVVELASRLAHGHSSVRINAAWELRQSDDPLANDALLDALTDSTMIVRVHAWHGLLRRWGLEHLATQRTSPLGTLFIWVVSDVSAVVTRGAERMARIVARMAEGASATDLGLDVPVPPEDANVGAFVASMRNHDVPIDVGAVRAMHPLHREWAVTMIAAAAAHPDPRAKVALEALDARWELDAIKGLRSEP